MQVKNKSKNFRLYYVASSWNITQIHLIMGIHKGEKWILTRESTCLYIV